MNQAGLLFWVFAIGCVPLDNEVCAKGICGCWEPATLDVAGDVRNSQLSDPVADVAVSCDSEATPVATTDANGSFSFSLETEVSPGCGYQRCAVLVFTPPAGSGLVPAEVPIESFLADPSIDLQYGSD